MPSASTDLVKLVSRAPGVEAMARALGDGRRCVATGSVGSSTALAAGAVARATNRAVLLVVAHLDDADEATEELICSGVHAIKIPALEASPSESGVASDLFATRVRLARSLVPQSGPSVIVAPIQALMQSVPAPGKSSALVKTLTKGERIQPQALAAWLTSAGFLRVDAVEEPGQFSLRGGILDVFPATASVTNASDGASAAGEPVPIRLDFFGDEIDRISEVDAETLASDRTIDSAEIVAADFSSVLRDDAGVCFAELMPAGFVTILAETMEIVEQARGYYERATDPKGIFGPPAVLKLLEQKSHALCEVNQFSAGATASEARIELAFASVPTFPQDAGEAIGELIAMAGGECRKENADESDELASERRAAPTHPKPLPEGGALRQNDQRSFARMRVIVVCQNEGEQTRFVELLAQRLPEGTTSPLIEAVVGYLHRGFIVEREEETERRRDGVQNTSSRRLSVSPSLALVPYHELLSRFHVRRSARVVRAARTMDAFLDFDDGDYVVHADHGIAKYVGLKLMLPREVPKAQRPWRDEKQTPEPEEFLVLEFAQGAKMYVPAMHIDKVQKYVGGFSGKPQLSVIGGQRWQTQKEKAAESVRDLAGEMLRVRAAREHLPGISFPHDTPWQNEFEAEFPYEETPDQLAGLQEIKRDMHAARPMDRLICGDVGFGKTELAIRAAFKACEFGKQVAVLVPTTVLAEQHERTFKSRFAGYPFRVESISRFKTDGEVREVLKELRKGSVDVIVGTHRLLSQDVVFSDLGLVIVDEEQRFGVEHKESLLRLRLTVDVLTLSATPIPRTLHMAMLGLRDISSLTTPPADRRAIVTEVIPFNARRVQQAIERELSREGQVFVVHNRVHDIKSFADDILKLAPGARIVIGHGQMSPHELEEVMLKFIRHEADILVSTTIIESGIDIANANTMIIHDADRFGLSDLHQLRGRVGRGKHRGYCYLLLPEDRSVRETAQKRLKALEQYSMLGAGFKIAMRDLEIRGAGNILGAEQSGHIAQVGYEMFCRLLEDAVHELRHEEKPRQVSSTSVEVGVSGHIPKAYIPSDKRRLGTYRRIATAKSQEDLSKAITEIREAYGEPPQPLVSLLEVAQLRIALSAMDVRGVSIRERDVIFLCRKAAPVAHELASRASTAAAREASIRVLPPESGNDLEMVYFRPPESYLQGATLLRVLRARLGLLPATPESIRQRDGFDKKEMQAGKVDKSPTPAPAKSNRSAPARGSRARRVEPS
ncbi:MAG: transcription-repair coupling factor [Phycisphaerales bacterium]